MRIVLTNIGRNVTNRVVETVSRFIHAHKCVMVRTSVLVLRSYPARLVLLLYLLLNNCDGLVGLGLLDLTLKHLSLCHVGLCWGFRA